MGDDGLVEVDAAQTLGAFGRADHLPVVAVVADDRCVEGPATEVVDGNEGAGADLGLVGDGRSHRLGHEEHLGQPRLPGRLTEQVEPKRTPRGGVGEGHTLGRAAFDLGDPLEHRRQHAGRERIGRVGLPAHDDGRRIGPDRRLYSRIVR